MGLLDWKLCYTVSNAALRTGTGIHYHIVGRGNGTAKRLGYHVHLFDYLNIGVDKWI